MSNAHMFCHVLSQLPIPLKLEIPRQTKVISAPWTHPQNWSNPWTVQGISWLETMNYWLSVEPLNSKNNVLAWLAIRCYPSSITKQEA